MKAGVEDRIVNERLGWKVYDGREFGNGLLNWYLSHDECV